MNKVCELCSKIEEFYMPECGANKEEYLCKTHHDTYCTIYNVGMKTHI